MAQPDWAKVLHIEDSSGGAPGTADALVDQVPTTCALLPPAAGPFGAGRSWVVMDLGSEGVVGQVSALAGTANATLPDAIS